MLKIVSPTGCVHAVDLDYSNTGNGNVTLCSHANYHRSYGEQYYHMWDKTNKDVTCKRCLTVLYKKIEHKENGWTRANRGCGNRYPHLKHGVLCNESAKFRAEVSMRKCESKLCPIPYVPSAAEMIEELVQATIINIGKELVRADRAFKLRFDMIAVHCGWRIPDTISKNWKKISTFKCTHGKLEDPRFGWTCGMGNCPHMNRAMDWRANHNM